MSATAPPGAQDEFPTSWEQYQKGNWPYEVIPLNPEEHDDALTRVGMHEFAFKAENGEVYAGCFPRAMINNSAHTDQPLIIGASVKGNRAVAIDQEERYRHMFGGGRTGEGKTVSAKNVGQQDGLSGTGFCFTDPGGEDIIDIVRCLPDYRLDDIIYMEPGNEYRDYSIGLNYLDTLHSPGEPGYKKECEAIASNILPMINADDFARMKGVASNMFRYLIKADYEDSEYDYTLIDPYFILCSQVGRERYAHLVNESKLEFLKPYAKEIAELAGDDFEPLIRRLQSWIENDVIRPFVAQRNSDFSIADAVSNNRIILVKANLGKNERELVSAVLTTKLWTAITSRPGEDEVKMMEHEGVEVPDLGLNDDGDYDPFFLIADEFHAIASEEDDIGEMLAMARKKGLGIYLLTQQLGQLSAEKQEQILGNCSTVLAFNPGRSSSERKALAAGFNGVSESDLGVDKYTFWTTLEGAEDQPFLTHSTPPYPPVRTVEEANEALNQAQKRYGSPRLTTEDIISQIPDEFTPEAARQSLDSSTSASKPSKPSPADRALVCKAAYDAAYRAGNADGWIPLKDAQPRIRRYLDDADSPFDPDTPSKTRELLKHIDPEALESADRDDGNGISIRCTPLGKRQFASGGNTDSDDAESDGVQENEGSWAHMQLIKDAYDDLMDLGVLPKIPAQDGGAMPDALATLDDLNVPTIDQGMTLDELRDLVETFENEHPRIERLTGGSDAYIELEKSTADTDPGQTVLNLVKAAKADKRCLFLTRPSTASNVWRTLMEEPRFCRGDWSVPGQDRLYNQDNLKIPTEEGMETMYRPAGPRQTAWIREGSRYILMDSEKNEHAVFDSAAEIFSAVEKYPHHTTGSVDSSKWTPVKRPVVPEYVFDGDLPSTDMYDVITVRSDETPLCLYKDGEETPLFDLGSGGERQTKKRGESVLDQL